MWGLTFRYFVHRKFGNPKYHRRTHLYTFTVGCLCTFHHSSTRFIAAPVYESWHGSGKGSERVRQMPPAEAQGKYSVISPVDVRQSKERLITFDSVTLNGHVPFVPEPACNASRVNLPSGGRTEELRQPRDATV